MTDSERQMLCDWLRHLPAYLSEDGMRAADEIERLGEAMTKGDFAKYAEQFNKEALERALAEPIPRSPAAQKLINDTFGVEDEMELITKIRNYEAPPLPDARPVAADYIPIGGAGNGA